MFHEDDIACARGPGAEAGDRSGGEPGRQGHSTALPDDGDQDIADDAKPASKPSVRKQRRAYQSRYRMRNKRGERAEPLPTVMAPAE